MNLHISRRSYSRTWGQQSSGVVLRPEPRDSHQETAMVRCGNVRMCILRDLWHHFTHYSVCMHQVRVSMCVCTESIHCPSPCTSHFISCALLHIILKLHLSLLSFGRSMSALILLHSSRRRARRWQRENNSVAHILTLTHSFMHYDKSLSSR
jgi:hypothetical protein